MALKRSHSGSDSSSASSSDSDSDVETRKRPIKNVYSSSESKSSDEEEEWNAKPAAKVKGKAKSTKKAAKHGKSNAKKAKKSESDDESNSDSDSDSASGSSYSSTNSPPAKKKFDKEEGEVDCDSDSSEEFNDGFDENLMGDEEDQKKLAEMTEKEREQELFNRSEKRELLRARFEIGKKLKKKRSSEPEVNKKEKEKKQRKKSETIPEEKENDDGFNFSSIPDNLPSRSTERRKQIEDNRKGKASIEILKAQREKKKLKQKLRAVDVFSDSSDSDSGKDRKRRSSSSSSDSSSSSNDDSDEENTSRRKNRRDRKERDSDEEKKEKFVVTLQNLNSLIVTRKRVESWCFAPFFRDTIVGCFVRVRSQLAKTQDAYFIGEVLMVVETPKTYDLGKGRTNLGIKIRTPGFPDQTFRLEFISNAYCSPAEFEIYTQLLNKHGMTFVSREHYEKKIKDIERAKNYNYTDADIDFVVKQKERFKTRPVNFAMKKAELMKEKIFAEQQNNHEKALELTREIDRLEAEAKEIEEQRTVHIKSISYINERNRNKNISDAALCNSSGGHQAIADDPFTRRRCAPQIYTKNKHADGEKVEEKKEENIEVTKESEPIRKKEDKKSSFFKDDDMFDAHNFDIKIDLPLTSPDSSISNSILADLGVGGGGGGGSNGGVFPKPANPLPKVENNRRLNLEEYKRKKGLI